MWANRRMIDVLLAFIGYLLYRIIVSPTAAPCLPAFDAVIVVRPGGCTGNNGGHEQRGIAEAKAGG